MSINGDEEELVVTNDGCIYDTFAYVITLNHDGEALKTLAFVVYPNSMASTPDLTNIRGMDDYCNSLCTHDEFFSPILDNPTFDVEVNSSVTATPV